MWHPPIWRTVPAARRYAVSDRGEVRSSTQLLRPHLNDEGYPRLQLTLDNGKRRQFLVHVLVALVHLPPPKPGQRYVLHDDRDRANPSASNLRWGTHQDNHEDKRRHGTLRATTRKLTPAQVRSIRRSQLGTPRLAAKLGLSISHVREIRNGRKHKKVA